MAEKWETADIQAIGNAWAEAKKNGAPQSVLDGLHQAAESLRAKAGYSGGSDGSKFTVIEKAAQVITPPKDETTIIEDTGESALGDPEDNFQADFPVYSFGSGSAASKGDTGTGQKILGFAVMFLVGVAILDKVMK